MSLDYVFLHFEEDNTYSVVHDDKKKFINIKKGNIKDADGEWKIGKIMFRGTKLECVKRATTDVKRATVCKAIHDLQTPIKSVKRKHDESKC
jgi:hypothetical protein